MSTPVYNFKKSPFDTSLGPERAFAHPSFQDAIKYFEAAIMRYCDVVVVTGAVGSGKTRVVEEVLRRYPLSNLDITRVCGARASEEGVLPTLAAAMELPGHAPDAEPQVEQLAEALKQRESEGRNRLLVLEGADNLDVAALGELQQLLMAYGQAAPGLQLFLLGSAELEDRLQDPALLGLSSRVLFTIELHPLTVEQTAEYISHRLTMVGWDGSPAFSADAIEQIHWASAGLPGAINTLCSALLEAGSSRQQQEFTAADVDQLCEQMGWEEPAHQLVKSAGLSASAVPAAAAAENDNDVLELFEQEEEPAQDVVAAVADESVLVLTEETVEPAEAESDNVFVLTEELPESVEVPPSAGAGPDSSVSDATTGGWKRGAAVGIVLLLVLVVWYLWAEDPAESAPDSSSTKIPSAELSAPGNSSQVPESQPVQASLEPEAAVAEPQPAAAVETELAAEQEPVAQISPAVGDEASAVSNNATSPDVEAPTDVQPATAYEEPDAGSIEAPAPEPAVGSVEIGVEETPEGVPVEDGSPDFSAEQTQDVDIVTRASGTMAGIYFADAGVFNDGQRTVISDELEAALVPYVSRMMRLDSGALRLELPSLAEPLGDQPANALAREVEELAFVLRNFNGIRIELKALKLLQENPGEAENHIQLAQAIRSGLIAAGLPQRWVSVVQEEPQQVQLGWLPAAVLIDVLPRTSPA